jgi:hypothetical protein
MDHTEICNSITLAAIEKMDLKQNLRTMKQSDYEEYVVDKVIDTYLKVSYAVINGEKMPE